MRWGGGGVVLVFEDIGHLTSFAVIGTRYSALALLWGTSWDAEGVPEESVLNERGWESGLCERRDALE